MNRREVIVLFGGALTAPAATRAQPSTPVIGLLGISRSTPESLERVVGPFRRGLGQNGFEEGRNVRIEYRWADGQLDRFPGLMDELVSRRVNVIVAIGVASTLDAKFAVSNVPIVNAFGGDPVKSGLVASLRRPGGNVTGLYILTTTLDPKRFELLSQTVPGASTIAVLVNRNDNRPQYADALKAIEAAALAAGRQLALVPASREAEFEPAFAAMATQRVGALMQTGTPFYSAHIDQLVALAARHKIPTMWEASSSAQAGGLMSYGNNFADAYQRMGAMVAKVLVGAKPAELPIDQATKVELVLNLKTAKVLGIAFPLPLLGRADEVIE